MTGVLPKKGDLDRDQHTGRTPPEDEDRGTSPIGPMVRTPHFHCRRHGFDSWSGN